MGKKLEINPVACESISAASAVVRPKVRYGSYTYIVWQRRDGQAFYALVTAENVKQMMLDAGTQGYKVLYGSQFPMILHWWLANKIRRQLISGWYSHN